MLKYDIRQKDLKPHKEKVIYVNLLLTMNGGNEAEQPFEI